MEKVWFLTGSAAGLGRSIAEAVLKNGGLLAATARNPERLADLKEQYGDRILTLELDVTDEKAVFGAVGRTLEVFGRIDVLVNNAGYGHFAPFEQQSSETFRGQIETNLFGVVNTSRAVLPHMRKRHSGHILNISSVGGRISNPGISAYQTAKWAVGGFSEALAKECAGFDVKVCCLEPGGIRTNWGVTAISETPEILPDYDGSVGALYRMLKDFVGSEMTSPEKFAQVILMLAERDELPLHLLIGADAVQFTKMADEVRNRQAQEYMDISLSTATDGVNVPELPVK